MEGTPGLLPGVRFELRLDLLPVLEEVGKANIGERMFEKLFDDLERHCRDVRADPRGFDHVQRMTDARREYLCFELIIVEDLANLLDQPHPVVPDVVQSTQERTDKARTRLGGHQRLRSIEDKRLIDANTL